ncbi:unnamed protein product [Brassica oleracea]
MAMELGPGIPRRCPCGAVTIVLTSKTKENPGHRFYRCGAVFGENHVFKWVDDAHLEELEAMADKQSILEKELGEIKEDVLEIKKDISEIVAVVGTLSELIRKLRNDDDIGVGSVQALNAVIWYIHFHQIQHKSKQHLQEEVKATGEKFHITMARLVRVSKGRWSKSQQGVWRLEEDVTYTSRDILVKRNEEYDSLQREIRSLFNLTEVTPLVVTFQLPEWMLEPDGETCPPHSILTTTDVEMLMSVHKWNT